MRIVAGTDVQALIATLVLGQEQVSDSLGSVTLHSHQREGADRVRHLLAAHGGALVADDVGLGKTYLALAVAKEFRRPLLVAPAAVRSTWEQALSATGMTMRIASFESLARNVGGAEPPDLVVIDEAQHVRNANTMRFAACRSLCANARVLLLSATPVQNREADLRTILSLFLGERAHAMTLEALAACIVRRESTDVGLGPAVPDAEPPRWIHPNDDSDCLSRIESLPPPLSAADEGDGGALLTYTLVKQWASSRAALRSALSRRIARAHALEDALSAGRMPTRAELGAWTFAGGSQQLAFPLIAATTVSRDAHALLERVRRHRDAVQEFSAWLTGVPDPDVSRALRLRELCAEHPDRRVIAFSEYADTVAALFRLVSPHLRVAMLTHAGGRVAAGRTTRRDLLNSFAPGCGARVHERDRVDLLLTTDVLSEGVGLHDASVVVHLDVPWNPARMAQRVGRVRRIGSAADTVLVYAMAAPVPAARMLDIESRLRRKVSDAARAVGVADEVLPGIGATREVSAAVRGEQRAVALHNWRSAAPVLLSGFPVCGAVRASRHGALVCVRVGGEMKLVAYSDRVIDNADVVDALVKCTSNECVDGDQSAGGIVVAAVNAWLQQHQATGVVDLTARRVAQSRRALIQRTERIARAMPRHARASVSPLLFAARSAAVAPLSAGAERVLEELTEAPLSDEAWLKALGEFASLHAAPHSADAIVAILLLVL